MIKFYQERVYIVNAGINVNRLVPFTEEMVFRLGTRLRGMSQVFNRKSIHVLYYGVKNKIQFKYFYYDILSGFYYYDMQSFVPFIVTLFVNNWETTMCKSTECNFSMVCELV